MFSNLSRLTFWPTICLAFCQPEPNADLEERSSQMLIAAIREPLYWDLLNNYTSLTKLLRITTICRRFILCLRRIPNSLLATPLTPLELEQSRIFWTKNVQYARFPAKIQTILRGEQLSRSNSLTRFIPFIDRQGLLRVAKRLHHANIDSEANNIRLFCLEGRRWVRLLSEMLIKRHFMEVLK